MGTSKHDSELILCFLTVSGFASAACSCTSFAAAPVWCLLLSSSSQSLTRHEQQHGRISKLPEIVRAIESRQQNPLLHMISTTSIAVIRQREEDKTSISLSFLTKNEVPQHAFQFSHHGVRPFLDFLEERTADIAVLLHGLVKLVECGDPSLQEQYTT